MHIFIHFRFNGEETPAAVSGVEGDITDMILPCVGDVVTHRDLEGKPMMGRVTERVFNYDLGIGNGVQGAVSVVIWIDRTLLH